MKRWTILLMGLLLVGCGVQPVDGPVEVTTTTTTTTTVPKDPYEQNKIAKNKEAYFQGTFVEYDGFIDPQTIEAVIVTDEEKLLDVTVLINKYYAIKPDWIPDDLVSIETNFDRPSKLRKEAAEAWVALDAAAKDKGFTLYARDGWRSESLQNTYFTQAYAKNKGNAARFNALPWRSEHQLGIALDVSDVTTTGNSLRQDFIDTPQGIFLQEEGYLYGWVVRYTKEKEMITQYNAEPWHIRYVGIELAKILHDNDLTLEEYYGEVYE